MVLHGIVNANKDPLFLRVCALSRDTTAQIGSSALVSENITHTLPRDCNKMCIKHLYTS